MPKINKSPRISVNKLGEYITSRATRQTKILRDQKFPPEYMTTYYREAEESISQFIATELQDFGIIERKISILEQIPSDNVYNNRRLSGNIEAIECFMNVMDKVDLGGASPTLGPQTAMLTVSNVNVSVRPEIILTKIEQKWPSPSGRHQASFSQVKPTKQRGMFVHSLNDAPVI